jgi:creatinine amidohydrolase
MESTLVKSMRFEDLSWMDVDNFLKQDDRLILVLGACEQHGYLSLLSDVKIPLALADAASQKSGVLVAPPVNFGCSPYFLSYPGTFSLRSQTLLDLVEDLLRSAHNQGFKRILVLNGHGGNDAARSRLCEIANEFPDLRLAWYSWWLAHSVLEVAQQHQLKPAHANWLEAFPFTIVTELPQEEKVFPRIPGLMNAAQARQVYGDGSFGGPYQAPKDVMQLLFDTALNDVLQLLKFD